MIGDALGVVPHSVAVDECRARVFGDAEHEPVDVRRHAAEHAFRRRGKVRRPLLSHKGVIAADASARDHHGSRCELESANDVAIRGHSASRDIWREPLAPHSLDATVVSHQLGHPMPRAILRAPLRNALAKPARKRMHEAGPGAPSDVKPRHAVAVTRRGRSTALCPPDNRKEADTALAQPGAFLACREVEVGLGPLTTPEISVSVESGTREPV